jgi:toxin YoeB
MLNIEFMPKAWLDLGWFVQNDLKNIKKIYTVLENTIKNPLEGIGQPEPLKSNYKGYWSRRINLEHRIVYKVEGDRIVVFSLKGHYQ